ncbi:MAG: hypothetical protein IKU90_01130 [Clostridia bacterium]|nr:hypothetical protein [Clostridia bacterium]
MKKLLRLLPSFLTATLLLTACTAVSEPPADTSDTKSAESAVTNVSEPADTTEAEAPAETDTDAEASTADRAEDTVAESESVSSDEVTEEDTVPDDQPDLCLVRDHASDFKIIYPKDASDYAINTVKSLRTALVRAYAMDDAPITFTSDRSGKETVKTDAYEILVGMTNRQESQEVAATLAPDSFTITSVGNKLVILGSDDYRTALAVEHFKANFISSESSELIFSHSASVTEEDPVRRVELAEGANVRIMSWNLHCPDAEDYALFTHMLNGILHYGPDIIGLQECNAAAHKGVVDILSQRYAVATTHHSGSNTYDYTPILYDPLRFDLLDNGVEWLDGRYTGTNTKCLSWAVFADKQNDGAKIIIINFHGAVANNTYKGMENMTKEELNAQANAWKIDNIHQVQRKISALEAKWGTDLPVFVSADYNTSKGAEPYTLMESYGYLDAEFNAVTSAMTGTKSTHTIGSAPVSGKSIDHIFYSPNRGITTYVHAFGLRESDLAATDHLPLFVDFSIQP